MTEEIVNLIRQALTQCTNPERDVVQVRACDLKDLIDAYDFFLEQRGSSDLWVPDHVKRADPKPFTKRLSRLQSDVNFAVDKMNALFHHVEPAGRVALSRVFAYVVTLLKKVNEEQMAVHREHFKCSPKEQV